MHSGMFIHIYFFPFSYKYYCLYCFCFLMELAVIQRYFPKLTFPRKFLDGALLVPYGY